MPPARAAESGGRLAGLPVPVKDNFDTADMPTTGGTPGLRDHRPRHNAPVVQRLIDEGACIMGKLNMHELAYGITSNNGAFGAVRNPYDPSRIPGGSSGGSGAAVAARMAPVALGSDTGGSVRIPAALCGVAGMRPTTGRYSQAGVVPISHTRDTAGPLARSVADLALFDSVITGVPNDLPTIPLRGARIGVPRGHYFDNLHPRNGAGGRGGTGRARSGRRRARRGGHAGSAEARRGSRLPDRAVRNRRRSGPLSVGARPAARFCRRGRRRSQPGCRRPAAEPDDARGRHPGKRSIARP